MKTSFAIIAIAATCIGCSKTAPLPPPTTSASTKVTASSPAPVPLTDASPAVDALDYPEKADVVAILFRTRELRKKSQFYGALNLVAKALEIDPESPSALSMQRELAEIVKKIEGPKESDPADPKSHRDVRVPA